MKNPLFLLAIFNFSMGMFFIFQDEIIARPAAYILQLNFIIYFTLLEKIKIKKIIKYFRRFFFGRLHTLRSRCNNCFWSFI